MKFWALAVLIIFGSFFVGLLAFNYIAMPLWVGLHEEVSVPDVCGIKIEKAKEILSKSGLEAEIKAQKFSDSPELTVISQYPSHDRRIKKGRKVALCISKGKEKVRVPWVRGMLLTQAQNLLQNSDIKIKEIIYEYSDSIPDEQVIRTEPPADSLITKNSSVTIFVSQGITELVLPDLTWKTLREARREANVLGLTLDVEYIAHPSPDGVVIAQSPLPGSPIRPGDILKLVVGLPR